jgi:alkaline phosphatase
MDDIVRQTAAQVKDDTLIIFTADHSFDLRMRSGKPGEPLLTAEPAANVPAAKPNVRVDDGHTGEQVLVAAQGPGAEKVHGFIKNTDLFHFMMSAYGWAGAAP